MISNLWMISAVVLPSGQIHQIIDQDLNPQIEEIFEGGSGTVDPEFAAIMTEKPLFEFSTTALATALGLVGLDGYAIAAATSFYFQRVSQGGVRDGAAAIKVALSKGMVVPKTIDAPADKPANITYQVYAISSDGTTAPLTITTGQTLPTINPVSELFTVGPVGLNSSTLSAVENYRWDFDIKCDSVAADGEAYPTFVGIKTRRPKCSVSGFDLSALSTFGMNGLALTTWKTYFRKIAAGGTRVAAGTAQHVKLSGTTGMFRPDSGRGTHEDQARGNWMISPTFDGTNAVIAVSTGSAIV